MIGWCDGLSVAARICWWHLPQMSASFAPERRRERRDCADRGRSWMLWQFEQETSFFACLPESQNARWRLPAWQFRQTAVFSVGRRGLAGQRILAAWPSSDPSGARRRRRGRPGTSSLAHRSSRRAASRSMDVRTCSWQFAQTGAIAKVAGLGCACDGDPASASAAATAAIATRDLSSMASPFCSCRRRAGPRSSARAGSRSVSSYLRSLELLLIPINESTNAAPARRTHVAATQQPAPAGHDRNGREGGNVLCAAMLIDASISG